MDAKLAKGFVRVHTDKNVCDTRRGLEGALTGVC